MNKKLQIVFVKYDDFSNVSDVIIIENKLSKSTAFTVRQKEGFGAILKGQEQMNIRSRFIKSRRSFKSFKRQHIPHL